MDPVQPAPVAQPTPIEQPMTTATAKGQGLIDRLTAGLDAAGIPDGDNLNFFEAGNVVETLNFTDQTVAQTPAELAALTPVPVIDANGRAHAPENGQFVPGAEAPAPAPAAAPAQDVVVLKDPEYGEIKASELQAFIAAKVEASRLANNQPAASASVQATPSTTPPLSSSTPQVSAAELQAQLAETREREQAVLLWASQDPENFTQFARGVANGQIQPQFQPRPAPAQPALTLDQAREAARQEFQALRQAEIQQAEQSRQENERKQSMLKALDITIESIIPIAQYPKERRDLMLESIASRVAVLAPTGHFGSPQAPLPQFLIDRKIGEIAKSVRQEWNAALSNSAQTQANIAGAAPVKVTGGGTQVPRKEPMQANSYRGQSLINRLTQRLGQFQE